MTGFDIPGLGGFDPKQFQTEILTAMSQAPRLQDPERIGRRAAPMESSPTKGEGFEGFLADSLEKVQALQDDTRAKTRGLALGEDVDLHDVMIAAGKSEVAFNLVLEVRNKLVDAWEKLSRSVM